MGEKGREGKDSGSKAAPERSSSSSSKAEEIDKDGNKIDYFYHVPRSAYSTANITLSKAGKVETSNPHGTYKNHKPCKHSPQSLGSIS